jgi:hypothetical protein
VGDGVRSLDELHTVDWAGLEHAYGDASDVPELLRLLVTDKHEQALGALYTTIVHQGSRYEATAHAVPFLLGLATDPATPARADLVRFLGALAIGDDAAFLPAGVDVAVWRARVARLLATAPADAYQEFDGWVAAAATEEERSGSEAARGEAAELAAYEAVLAGAPAIVELLDDSSAAIRAAAVYVLGWLPSSEPAPRVRTLLVGVEPDGVVGNAVVTLGLLGVPPATVRPYLGHACPTVRWAAAIALARLGEVTPQVVEALSGFVVEPPPQTEPPVHVHDGDFRGYAAISVAALRDEAPSSTRGASASTRRS